MIVRLFGVVLTCVFRRQLTLSKVRANARSCTSDDVCDVAESVMKQLARSSYVKRDEGIVMVPKDSDDVKSDLETQAREAAGACCCARCV
jgi:hypothetical protein